MAWVGGQYAVTTGAVTLTSALGLSAKQYIKQIDVLYSADAQAASRVYLGPSTVTNTPTNAWIKLGPAVSWSKTEGSTQAPLHTDQMYIVGTAANALNLVFIDIVY